MDVAIIADDLTGAADSAMEFSAPGRRVRIALGAPIPNGADVLAVDVDSRELSPAEAAWRVAAAVQALVPPPELWYKKLDSTLRGNVAAELTAFATWTGCSLLLVAPAFPAQGRGYVAGTLCSDERANGGEGPAPHLPTMLAGMGRTVELFSLGQVRAATTAMQARLRALPQGTIVVADAVSDRDLDSIVAATVASGRRVAFAGSAGLAAALGRTRGADIRDVPSLSGLSRVLLIVGSRHQAARRQLAHVADRLGPPLVWPGDVAPAAMLAFASRVEAAFACHDTLLLTTPDAVVANPGDFNAGLARVAARLITNCGVERVFCTGGEVARAVSDQLGVRGFSVMGRVQEGMPALSVDDGRSGLVMVTKAGGFGDDDTLLRAGAFLAGGGQACR